jgi:hypothetical protein
LCFDHFDQPIRGAVPATSPFLKKSVLEPTGWKRTEMTTGHHVCTIPNSGFLMVPVDSWGNQPNPFVWPSYENEGFVLGNAWANPAVRMNGGQRYLMWLIAVGHLHQWLRYYLDDQRWKPP